MLLRRGIQADKRVFLVTIAAFCNVGESFPANLRKRFCEQCLWPTLRDAAAWHFGESREIVDADTSELLFLVGCTHFCTSHRAVTT